MSNLKPCPHGCPESVLRIEAGLRDGEGNGLHYAVRCDSCDSYGPMRRLKRDAVACWNRRPIEDALRAEIASLKAKLDGECAAHADRIINARCIDCEQKNAEIAELKAKYEGDLTTDELRMVRREYQLMQGNDLHDAVVYDRAIRLARAGRGK